MSTRFLKPSQPLGSLSDHIGRHWVSLICQNCQRVVTHDPIDLIDRLGKDMPCAELTRRARCQRCGLRVAQFQISGGGGMAGMLKPRMPD